MKALFKHFKPYDFVLVGLALLLTFSPWIYTAITEAKTTPSLGERETSQQESVAEEPRLQAIVTIDGEEVDRYTLGPGTGHEEKTYYPHPGQYNIIEKDNERIRVKEDNSPDQIAVRTGWIDRQGYVSICLPHGLIIEIVGAIDEEELVLPL